MKNWRIEEKNTNSNIKAKIINLKNYRSDSYPILITVKKVELKAQNFKNKTIKQSYNIEFLPNIPGLYINKTNIYTKKLAFQVFENSDLYYMYNVRGEKNGGFPIYYIKKELKILNKELFKLRKSKKPLELLPELFENLWDENYKSRRPLYAYYDAGGVFYLTQQNFEKDYKVFFNIYLHIWRDFIFNTYKVKFINLTLESLKKYNAYGLCKLQALIDLSELGYVIPYEINPLENLFYYIKAEKAYKTSLVLEAFKKYKDVNFLFYLKNLPKYIENNQEKQFLKDYMKKYEPNKFEGLHYSWQAEYTGIEYITWLHSLEYYYKIFGLKLSNDYGLSHFGQKHLYLQNYIYTEGPCLTASLELQKIKQLNINGIKIKKNSFFSKLSLEQLSLAHFVSSREGIIV